MNFTQEMGYLTNDTLHTYQNFQTAGMVIKKKVFDDYGKFKPSFKLTFIYELVKFILISVPLAVTLYLTAHFIYELKRIINGIRFGAKRIRELN